MAETEKTTGARASAPSFPHFPRPSRACPGGPYSSGPLCLFVYIHQTEQAQFAVIEGVVGEGVGHGDLVRLGRAVLAASRREEGLQEALVAIGEGLPAPLARKAYQRLALKGHGRYVEVHDARVERPLREHLRPRHEELGEVRRRARVAAARRGKPVALLELAVAQLRRVKDAASTSCGGMR